MFLLVTGEEGRQGLVNMCRRSGRLTTRSTSASEGENATVHRACSDQRQKSVDLPVPKAETRRPSPHSLVLRRFPDRRPKKRRSSATPADQRRGRTALTHFVDDIFLEPRLVTPARLLPTAAAPCCQACREEVSETRFPGGFATVADNRSMDDRWCFRAGDSSEMLGKMLCCDSFCGETKGTGVLWRLFAAGGDGAARLATLVCHRDKLFFSRHRIRILIASSS